MQQTPNNHTPTNQRFLSPTVASSQRRKQTVQQQNQTGLLTPKRKEGIRTPTSSNQKLTNSVPSMRSRSNLYEPQLVTSSSVLRPNKAAQPRSNAKQPTAPSSFIGSPNGKGILKSPKSQRIQLGEETNTPNLHTLGICSPFSPQPVETPFYKKQGKFGTLILQTSLSKLTKGILLDKEEYLTIGKSNQCNIRINHDCVVKLDPDYDEEGYPCIFLCVYKGANLVKLNGELLEGLLTDDTDGILLKHDDEIRIVDKLFYYENVTQYERERLKSEVLSSLPIFDNKENTTPTKQQNNANFEQLASPPSKQFLKYVDTPSRKDSVEKTMVQSRKSINLPYNFHVDTVQLGSLTVSKNSSLIFDCQPSGIEESTERLGRKSVSFGEADSVVYYKPTHEPKRVSAVHNMTIEDDFGTTTSSLTDDSTISFGCDGDGDTLQTDLTQTITSMSNICQVIHLQDQACTVQPLLQACQPTCSFFDASDLESLVGQDNNPSTENDAVKSQVINDEDSQDAITLTPQSASSKGSSTKKRSTPIELSDSDSDLSSVNNSPGLSLPSNYNDLTPADFLDQEPAAEIEMVRRDDSDCHMEERLEEGMISTPIKKRLREDGTEPILNTVERETKKLKEAEQAESENIAFVIASLNPISLALELISPFKEPPLSSFEAVPLDVRKRKPPRRRKAAEETKQEVKQDLKKVPIKKRAQKRRK